MKGILPATVVILLTGFIVASCDQDLGLDQLSELDQEALSGMEREMEFAALYNDSLAHHINDTGNNNDTQCWYFDDHYHQHDSLYDFHHNNYSHSNGWDDHTMGSGGMMRRHHQNGNFPGNMGHYQRNHEFMDSLHIIHQNFHPEY